MPPEEICCLVRCLVRDLVCSETVDPPPAETAYSDGYDDGYE